MNTEWTDDRIEQQRQRLATLKDDQDKLYKELDRSLEIRKFWPEAFDCGQCKSSLLRTDGRGIPVTWDGQPSKLRFLIVRITREDGQTRDIPAVDVSPDLLKRHGWGVKS